jgi:SAM-dependent methyltransferase
MKFLRSLIPRGAASDPLDVGRRFWDAKALENPYWYVSNYGPYRARDLGDFWRAGLDIWAELKQAISYVPARADTLVEIGCGVGRLTHAIAADVGHVHAFDLSREMLAVARRRDLANVTFHHADGDSLRPLPAQSAEVVLAYCVFQHLPSTRVLERYLHEMVRVAKPSGIVTFTLSPRTWSDNVRPLIQAKAWMKERLGPGGPRGLYRRAWLGIRPRPSTVAGLCPIPLTVSTLHGDKWLFSGRIPAATRRAAG